MKRVPQIESDTPLRPRAVAEGVWEEAGVWLGEPLPRRWLRELIAQANTVYAHNERFRRKLRANGNTGRGWLWIFTRHWLAALIHERRPHLHARLPESYNTGHPLPPRPAVPSRRKEKRPHPQRPLPSLPAKLTDHAWAAAAHYPLDLAW
jgi:hypothetical protein